MVKKKSAKIKLCIDARMINNSGIGVYIQKYLSYLLDNNSFEIIIIGRLNEINFYFKKYKNWRFIEANFAIYSVAEQLVLPFIIPDCDVFWSPHYNVPLLPIKAKRLVTIPDVYHLAYFQNLSLMQKIYARLVMNTAVSKSKKIITISNYSKNEICRLTDVDSNKIEIVHLGIDSTLFKPIFEELKVNKIREKYNLPEKYILFVGNVKPNKNLRRLVDGFFKILGEFPELSLVITGKKEGFITGDQTLFDRINNDKLLTGKILFTGYVDLEDLPILYNSAQLFAFPSIYEGFGFPPLEAMACGCPVVASNTTSIPEICGNAAFYVDPLSSDSIADGLKAVLKDDLLRNQLVNDGYKQASLFDWEKSYEKFIEILMHKV